jgi:hypothetical protein
MPGARNKLYHSSEAAKTAQPTPVKRGYREVRPLARTSISCSVRPLSHRNQKNSQVLPRIIKRNDRRARKICSPRSRVGLRNEKHEVRMPMKLVERPPSSSTSPPKF